MGAKENCRHYIEKRAGKVFVQNIRGYDFLSWDKRPLGGDFKIATRRRRHESASRIPWSKSEKGNSEKVEMMRD